MNSARSVHRIRIFLGLLTIWTIWALFFGGAWASSEITGFYSRLREETLQNSYELQILRSTVEQKSAQSYTAWTRWMPRVDLQLIQSRAQDYSFVTSGALGILGQNFRPEPLSLARWELSSTMPLYRRSVFQGVTLALAEKQQAQMQLELKLSEVDWRLRMLAGSYLYEVYRLVALESAAALAKTTLKEAELSFTLGQKTKVDVLRAKANLVLMDSKKAGFEQARVAAWNTLFEYVGVSQERAKGLELDRQFLSKISPHDLGETQVLDAVNGLVELEKALIPVEPYLASDAPAQKVALRLSAQSAVLRGLVIEEELAHSRAKTVMNTEWPELLLKGSLNKQAQDWNGALSSGNQSYSAAVVLSIPLFSGGSTISTYLEQVQAQKAAETKLRKDADHLRAEVENQLNQIRALKLQCDSQQVALAQHEEIVRLSQKSYQLGKMNLSEVLSSQNDLFDTKVGLMKTRLDLGAVARQCAWNLGELQP